MAAIVSVVVFALAGVLLSFANHQSSASNNDGVRQQSIDAAMAGLSFADSALTNNKDYAGTGSSAVAFPGGGAEFEVTVTAADATVSASGLGRIVKSVSYAPTKAAAKVTRTVEQVVVLAPVSSGGPFTFGVFAGSGFNYPNDSIVTGNLYSASDPNLHGATYIGSVYTHGSMTSDSAQVTGNIYTDHNASLNNTTKVTGSVYAGDNITIGNSGIITQVAQARGTISSGGQIGSRVPGSAPVSPNIAPNVAFPAFTPPTPTTTLDGDHFKAAASAAAGISGVFKVTNGPNWNPGDQIRLNGDTTIFFSDGGNVQLPQNSNSGVSAVVKVAGSPATVRLSYISTGGFSGNGNLTIPPEVKTVLYTTGSLGANKLTFTGALYVGGNISINNAGCSITFEPGLTTPGFSGGGASSGFTIKSISTREINNS